MSFFPAPSGGEGAARAGEERFRRTGQSGTNPSGARLCRRPAAAPWLRKTLRLVQGDTAALRFTGRRSGEERVLDLRVGHNRVREGIGAAFVGEGQAVVIKSERVQ